MLVQLLVWAANASAQGVNDRMAATVQQVVPRDVGQPPTSSLQAGAKSTAKSDEDAASSPDEYDGISKGEIKSGAKSDNKSEEKVDNTIANSGIKLTLQEQSEVWANLIGGGKRGTTYNGLTTAIVDIDLEKAMGWRSAQFYLSGFDIHGHGPSRSLVGNNQLISNIEATPSAKLYDLWLDQRLPGRLSIRFGQEGANDEMMTTVYGALYLNSSFGFPGLPAADLPSGGPNYPLATPFVRVRWRANDQWSLVGAVFNGDPAPPGIGDPQIRDRNGTAFRVDDHALIFGEVRYAADLDAPDTLQTNYKLGTWYHTGRFADRRFDIAGGLLADPRSSGLAKQHRGDLAIYGIVDEILWRRDGTKDQGLGAFLQVEVGPSDRNLADLFVEAGFNWVGPFPDRPQDIGGIAFAYLGISPTVRNFGRDLVAFGRAASPFASNETIIEASYKAVVADWLTLQPDAQFVLNPNAGMPTPFGPRPLPNAFLIGLRVTIKFQSS